jgi:hypothetical protein
LSPDDGVGAKDSEPEVKPWSEKLGLCRKEHSGSHTCKGRLWVWPWPRLAKATHGWFLPHPRSKTSRLVFWWIIYVSRRKRKRFHHCWSLSRMAKPKLHCWSSTPGTPALKYKKRK